MGRRNPHLESVGNAYLKAAGCRPGCRGCCAGAARGGGLTVGGNEAQLQRQGVI